MSQLIFKFPFKTRYYEQDFYVSSNNFSAYKLIESWPNWPGKWLNIFGAKGSGKTHLSNILVKKIPKTKIILAKNINDKIIHELESLDCLIIDKRVQVMPRLLRATKKKIQPCPLLSMSTTITIILIVYLTAGKNMSFITIII